MTGLQTLFSIEKLLFDVFQSKSYDLNIHYLGVTDSFKFTPQRTWLLQQKETFLFCLTLLSVH